jgi:hypothetical protein
VLFRAKERLKLLKMSVCAVSNKIVSARMR